jgi:adducin
MTDTEQQQQIVTHTNGNGVTNDDDEQKQRPADIEQDMREMERRKRVEAIMCSRMFREELERIVDGQMKEGPSNNILQQISDMMGVPSTKVGSYFRGATCVIPINDIRGIESMGYEKGEKILRCKLAATFRLLDLYGLAANGINNMVTARLNAAEELFLTNPFGLLYHEVTASSLNKVDMQGAIVEQGTTNYGINNSQFSIHASIHAARPDIRCIIGVLHNAVVAVSSFKQGILPLTKDSAVLGEIARHNVSGGKIIYLNAYLINS